MTFSLRRSCNCLQPGKEAVHPCVLSTPQAHFATWKASSTVWGPSSGSRHSRVNCYCSNQFPNLNFWSFLCTHVCIQIWKKICIHFIYIYTVTVYINIVCLKIFPNCFHFIKHVYVVFLYSLWVFFFGEIRFTKHHISPRLQASPPRRKPEWPGYPPQALGHQLGEVRD